MYNDIELATIKKKVKPEYDVHYQPDTQKEESHYQCLSTTNREEPEKFMNASRKQETELYMNIDHVKKEAQPSPGLSQGNNTTDAADTDEGAADFTPTPAVLSHYRAMEILKTYIKAKPEHRNAAGSDSESNTSDFTQASSHSPPQQTVCNAYINTPTSIGKRSLIGPENSPDTAPCGDNFQTLSSSSKKDERGCKNKSLLFSIVVCSVLVIFLVFTLLLTFVGLNRSELMKNQAEDSHSTALIMNLTKQVRDLEESLSQSNATLSIRLESQMSDYRDLVSNNNDTLTASISGNYADLKNQINSLQDLVNTNNASANHKISQLQNGINLESRCRKNSVSCDVFGNTHVYQLSCSTQNISMTTGVSHLLACSPSIHSIPISLGLQLSSQCPLPAPGEQ